MIKLMGLVLGSLILLPFSCGGGGGGGAPATAKDACRKEVAEGCDRAYACVVAANRDSDFMSLYGTDLNDCKTTVVDTECASAATDCPHYAASKTAACDTETKGLTCDAFLNPATPTPACDAVCPAQ
jgi:hypothetical protein